MTTKLVVDLKRFESGERGRVGVVFDLNDLSPGVREVASEIEKEYADVVYNLRRLREDVMTGKSTIINRWETSKKLDAFFASLGSKKVKVRSSLRALIRDSGFSRTELKYLMKFYRLLPERRWISGEVSWSVYKGVLDKTDEVRRMKAMSRVLRGNLKTEYQVRHS